MNQFNSILSAAAGAIHATGDVHVVVTRESARGYSIAKVWRDGNEFDFGADVESVDSAQLKVIDLDCGAESGYFAFGNKACREDCCSPAGGGHWTVHYTVALRA